MPDADALLNRALLEILRDRRGDIDVQGVSDETDRHFAGCPDATITSVDGEARECGNGTCNIGRISMTIGCPHHPNAWATLDEYGSLSSLLDQMYRIGQNAIDGDAYEEDGSDV